MSDLFINICHQDTERERWLEERKSGIGASEAAGVLNRGGSWTSAVKVFADKIMGEEDTSTIPEHMQWGIWMEPLILHAASERMGVRLWHDGCMKRSIEWPFMFATADGCHEDPEVGVECKAKMFPLTAVPEHDWIQMQHQMAVIGYKRMLYAAVGGLKGFYEYVDRDEAFIDEVLVPECEKFWTLVQNESAPPSPDASDATKKALARIYPQDDGGSTLLDGDFLELDDQRREIMMEIAGYNEQKQGIDNRFKAAIGDHSFGVLPNGDAYSLKANKNGTRILRAPKRKEES